MAPPIPELVSPLPTLHSGSQLALPTSPLAGHELLGWLSTNPLKVLASDRAPKSLPCQGQPDGQVASLTAPKVGTVVGSISDRGPPC